MCVWKTPKLYFMWNHYFSFWIFFLPKKQTRQTQNISSRQRKEAKRRKEGKEVKEKLTKHKQREFEERKRKFCAERKFVRLVCGENFFVLFCLVSVHVLWKNSHSLCRRHLKHQKTTSPVIKTWSFSSFVRHQSSLTSPQRAKKQSE